MNSLILPEFEHIWDYMPAQCPGYKISIKTEQAIQDQIWVFVCTKGK